MEKANAISSRPILLLFVCCAIVILVVLGLCWNSGYFDSNRTIAAFTAMLVITSTLQWWTYHRQWQQMRIASEQTNQIIEHMRNEQRPWLAVKKPEIYYARNDDKAKFQFDLTNHG